MIGSNDQYLLDLIFPIACFSVIKAKGSPSDLSGSIPNSIEDAENMDRPTSISTGRPWVDPSARVHVCEAIVIILFSYSASRDMVKKFAEYAAFK